MDSNLLGKYLIFFAKFDYAIARYGFFKKGRKINNQENIKTIDSDWDAFADKLSAEFYEEIKKNEKFAEIFKEGGPKIWAAVEGQSARFHSDISIKDTKTLIYACKHIRNNLIHGEKFQNDKADIERNYALLRCAREILIIAMKRIKDPKGFTVFSHFEDIPISDS